MDNFLTIKDNSETEIVVKKSKFIANLIRVQSREDAEKEVKKIKKQYFDARHNCIAYRVLEDGNVIERFSDDGEPSGTAGQPMLNILQKNNLVNVLIVVTRYFGGILLGTGGLVRAYSDATIKAIENANIVSKVFGNVVNIEVEYKDLDNFKYYLKNENINIEDISYVEKIIIKIELTDEELKKINQLKNERKLNINKIDIITKKYILK